LKKLGAYVIILMGDFSHELAIEMMNHLHTFVDVIIGKNKFNIDSSIGQSVHGLNVNFTSDHSVHYHYKTVKFSEHIETSHDFHKRIHLFQEHAHHYTYGKVHVRKSSDYKITLVRSIDTVEV